MTIGKRLTITFKGAVLALILTLMFSLLLAAGMWLFDISDGLFSTLIFAIAAFSCMSGAYAVCKAIGSKGLLTGGLLGLIYYLILTVAAFFIKKDLGIDSHSLIMLVCAVLSGMLGGVLGMPR